ncbi:MAG: ParB N-terminal domain-containing protein [Planctomycetes bacterium]|nr:ParB N-terminal domain-containing protein [Planctomycetota bacterium]
MKLQVEYVKPEELKAASYNPRSITTEALSALARLMDMHGFVDPVIARRQDNLLVSGHQRIRANSLRRTPDEFIPCVFLDNLDDERAKALNIALNNPAAQGQFDEDRLAELLSELDEDPDLPEITGFSPHEIEELTGALDEFEPIEGAEQAAEGDAKPPAVGQVTQEQVIVVFEIPADVYRRVRPHFDDLIGRYNLACHIRLDDEA